MSRSRIASGPVHTHTASATDLPSALAMLQRLALGSGDGWRRLVVDLSTPLDPIHEICGRALGRRVVFKSRSGRTIAGVDAALRGDWIDDITLSALRGLVPDAAVLAWSRFDPAVESSSGWMPFGRRGWILPRLQLEADEGRHRLVGYLLPGERPEAIEPARASLLVPRRAPVTARMYRQEENSDFRDLVHGAIDAIRSRDLVKVVLARKVSYALSEPIDAAYVLHQLASGNQYAFLVESGEHAFLGASPERLSRRIGQRLQTEMLAGTVRARSADEAMQLLESSKDRHEHDVVVRSVTERLSSVAKTRKNEDQVAVVPAAGGLWHLRRQLELTLNDAVDDASVLGLLHPTPAVCGRPTNVARTYLSGQEGFDRGLYAGPIGLFDGSGHDVAVAIRSLRLSPEMATLFAGAGIVRDSEPEMEFVETEAKLAVARAALPGTG
ncbi:MAG: isochorismate synthase [Planctomycetota bacterium]|nr:isochorismate synthase [Planctomycetota bacterium]